MLRAAGKKSHDQIRCASEEEAGHVARGPHRILRNKACAADPGMYPVAVRVYTQLRYADVAPPPPVFDVITEIWFTSMEKYREMHAATADPAVDDRIKRDEENFLDRTSMTMFLVDERITAK
jgi:hypothetical protein